MDLIDPCPFLSQCTDVRFAIFLSGGFITAIVVNPLERNLAKPTFVQCNTTLPIRDFSAWSIHICT